MTDRRRNPEFKNVTAYLPVDLATRFKREIKQRRLTQNEAIEEAIKKWLDYEPPEQPENIHDLVGRNLQILEEKGFKPTKIKAIAKGEVLPTAVDFCQITSLLGVPEDEKKRLWKLAYQPKHPKNDANQSSEIS
ncbi:MAG: ribbon-helix-helix domain-containing protein [Cyanobacteria bacterium J06643_5]